MREKILDLIQNSKVGIPFFFIDSTLSDYSSDDIRKCLRSMVSEGLIKARVAVPKDRHAVGSIIVYEATDKGDKLCS